jgi:hypothetical protein
VKADRGRECKPCCSVDKYPRAARVAPSFPRQRSGGAFVSVESYRLDIPVGKTAKQNYAVRVLHDGSVEMGTVDADGGNWKRQHAANRQWKFGQTATLRLLLRRGMMEIYLDDHFMECWTMGSHRAKEVTIAVPGQTNSLPVKDLKVWQMTLPAWKSESIN